MARRKSDPEKPEAEPGFEDALASLEAIVEAMEHEQLPLEEIVSHYEKGSALLAHCESILKSARERIELITLRNQSPPPVQAATGDDFSTASDQPDDSDDDHEIRLF